MRESQGHLPRWATNPVLPSRPSQNLVCSGCCPWRPHTDPTGGHDVCSGVWDLLVLFLVPPRHLRRSPATWLL